MKLDRETLPYAMSSEFEVMAYIYPGYWPYFAGTFDGPCERCKGESKLMQKRS
jgi:hypothetical protein